AVLLLGVVALAVFYLLPSSPAEKPSPDVAERPPAKETVGPVPPPQPPPDAKPKGGVADRPKDRPAARDPGPQKHRPVRRDAGPRPRPEPPTRPAPVPAGRPPEPQEPAPAGTLVLTDKDKTTVPLPGVIGDVAVGGQ